MLADTLDLIFSLPVESGFGLEEDGLAAMAMGAVRAIVEGVAMTEYVRLAGRGWGPGSLCEECD